MSQPSLSQSSKFLLEVTVTAVAGEFCPGGRRRRRRGGALLPGGKTERTHVLNDKQHRKETKHVDQAPMLSVLMITPTVKQISA